MSITYLVHLKNGPITSKATTQRLNFPFNSFCKFNGKYLAASDTIGICELGGKTDNGTPISAYFVPIQTDFGTSFSKRMRAVHHSIISSGGFYTKLSADDGTEYEYSASGAKESLQRVKVKVGEGTKGVYWRFEFGNVSGSDFRWKRI